MAKIKFNLNFGGEQIRTLDDLRDNFSIEDVLDVYSNGLFTTTNTNLNRSMLFRLPMLEASSLS